VSGFERSVTHAAAWPLQPDTRHLKPLLPYGVVSGSVRGPLFLLATTRLTALR
jgi:hypothetical protein